MLNKSQTFTYPGSSGEFLAAFYGHLEQAPYRDYRLIDRGDYLIFRHQPASLRPFGNNTGLSAKIELRETSQAQTRIILTEAHSRILVGLLLAFAIVCVAYAIFVQQILVLAPAVILLVGAVLLNRFYHKNITGVFAEIIQDISE